MELDNPALKTKRSRRMDKEEKEEEATHQSRASAAAPAVSSSSSTLLTAEQRLDIRERELNEELEEAEAEVKKWSKCVKRAIFGEKEHEQHKAEYKTQQNLFQNKVVALVGQISALWKERKELRAKPRILSVDEATEKVLETVTWRENVDDFEPKLLVVPDSADPAMPKSLREAKVYGKFFRPQKPDFLLTEMQKGWTSSSELVRYSFENGMFKKMHSIDHGTLKDFGTVVLFGTSGAGKTAASLRLAAKDFAMLFVCDPRGNAGSLDVKILIDKAEKDFSASGDPEKVEVLVQREFRKLLLFRNRVLEMCKSRYPSFSPVHWVMAQLYPTVCFGLDIFEAFLNKKTEEGDAPSLPVSLRAGWIVLDESQLLELKLVDKFKSRQEDGSPQSLLAPFIRALEDVPASKLICGRGLSASSVTETTLSPTKASAKTIVVGVTTYLNQSMVEDALKGWGIPIRDEVMKKTCALFAGRPRQATYLAQEMIRNNGIIKGISADILEWLFQSALEKTRGLDPDDPRAPARVKEAGDDLFALLQDAALDYVLGRSGAVKPGLSERFAVEYGICTLSSSSRKDEDNCVLAEDEGNCVLAEDEGNCVLAEDEGNCVLAEALVVKAFGEPMASIFEKRLSKAMTTLDQVDYTVVDYLAVHHSTLTSAVKAAASWGKAKLKIPCEAFVRDWKYLDEEYYVRIVTRCSNEGEETTMLQSWIEEKRSGMIMPHTNHGADLILLNWDNDQPLVVIVQSKSGHATTPEALRSLTLPYTTNRKKGSTIESGRGQEWEQLLVQKHCLVAYVVFKPLTCSKQKAVEFRDGRLIVIIDKNSWQRFASELKPGIEALNKFKQQ